MYWKWISFANPFIFNCSISEFNHKVHNWNYVKIKLRNFKVVKKKRFSSIVSALRWTFWLNIDKRTLNDCIYIVRIRIIYYHQCVWVKFYNLSKWFKIPQKNWGICKGSIVNYKIPWTALFFGRTTSFVGIKDFGQV